MTTRNYAPAWKATQEIASRYNNEVKTVVIGVNNAVGFYALSLFTESLAGELGSTPIDICSALRSIETWMYGYCTSFAKPLVQ